MIDNNAIADALENCDWSDTSIGTKGILLVAINALRDTPSIPVEEGAVPVGWRERASQILAAFDKANAEPMVALANYGEVALSFLRSMLAAAPHPPRQDGAREGRSCPRSVMTTDGDGFPIDCGYPGCNCSTTPPAPDEAHTISMSFAAYEEAIAEAEARGRAGHKGTGEPPSSRSDEALNWRVEKAVEAEQEACAELAASYGPSRPIIKKDPDDIIKARWEGEQAASDGISRLILARGAFDKRTLRQVLENELIDAVDFFDKVRASTQEEQVAVGQDHYNRLDIAVRKLVSFLRPKK